MNKGQSWLLSQSKTEGRKRNIRRMTTAAPPTREAVQDGDIVTIDLDLNPENDLVLEPLFDTHGQISFIVGWGNYLPGLHELVTGMEEGESSCESETTSIDAGWGTKNPDLIIEVPKPHFETMNDFDSVKIGSILNLKGGIQVTVIDITDSKVVVDANPPLAGSSYSCHLHVETVTRFPTSKLLYSSSTVSDPSSPSTSSKYEIATWAMGCFWGGELAFMRTPGVVGTKVGYTQGCRANPSYEEVSSGKTKHREAIMVVYDPDIVSYSELVKIFMERLAITISQYKMEHRIFQEADDEDDEQETLQYKHGMYYHNDEQRKLAEKAIEANNNKFNVEVMPATVFYDAEEYHQQYLLKGGQSARKNAKETIRCFG